MPAERSSLRDRLRQRVERRRCRPLDFLRWLPLQYQFLASSRHVKQIRCGNQTIGKTTPALAEVVGRCVGVHPLGPDGPPIPRPPIEAWVICASWSQSLGIQKKLHALLPAEELDDRTKYDAINGFAPTKSPVVLFKNGSIIRIKTTGQDALDFAGATIDLILFDEPPRTSRMFTEALMRVQERGGVLLLSYTPVNAPTEYLRELVDTGQIEDHWRPLTPSELIPVGGTEPIRTHDGRPKDADWIADREAKVPEHERPVVVHGEWEMRAVGRYFSMFRNGGSASHVHEVLPDWDVELVLGIDHGNRPGKQIAVLMAVWWHEDGYACVYVLDEYVDVVGNATPEQDATGILAMLAEHGYNWSDLAFAGGDRVHLPGRGEQKSNKDLSAQIAKKLRVPIDKLHPQIRTSKRGAGRGAHSVGVRSRWLYNAMLRAGAFGVHPSCTRTIQAIENYTLRDDDFKDPIDAIVYGLDREIFAPPKRGKARSLLVA